MKRVRFSETDHRGLEGGGSRVEARGVVSRHGILDARFYTWRSKYGGLEVSEMWPTALLCSASLIDCRRSFRRPYHGEILCWKNKPHSLQDASVADSLRIISLAAVRRLAYLSSNGFSART